MQTFRIIHYPSPDSLGIDVYTSSVFRKTELEYQFDALVRRLKPGESAEYMKEDNIFFYPSLAYVENENGILYTYTTQGHKCKSKYNYAENGVKKVDGSTQKQKVCQKNLKSTKITFPQAV